ncbi:MAG: hypothetical protein KC800_02330 [Candidatus Eremiobacteraeota bacterium]|nr:hypothetical protein [Candidatus Eremiobacteraeota bacterium]
MTEPRNLRTALGFGHYLFVSALFFAGGIHEGTEETFLGAPLISWPYFSQTSVQALLYLTGLAALAVLVEGLRGRASRWPVYVLTGILVIEFYLVTLDFRLAGRFWWLLLLTTVAAMKPRADYLRVLFFALPASGYMGLLSLFFTPLIVRSDRRLFGAMVLFLGFQGLHDSRLDTTLFAWLLLASLFREQEETRSNRSLLVGVTLVAVVAWGSWSLWKPLKVTVSFEYEAKEHHLTIERGDGRTLVSADGRQLPGPWYIDERLFANAYYFTLYPERLASSRLYDIYAEELQRRFQVKQVRISRERL